MCFAGDFAAHTFNSDHLVPLKQRGLGLTLFLKCLYHHQGYMLKIVLKHAVQLSTLCN